ncbi:hypothetical protein LP52_06955 [Streptomonospora alba]|uniref:Uncharacterized protein n=2 Tax=Streptomonospora alba TaxID=183763 RepID=A0A0C2G8D4_9ACTN|nr:hypothetical protein LP52_06955 [Streptomonospora alba]
MTLVEDQEARDLPGAVSEAVKNGEISVQAPQSALSHGQTKVYTVDAEDKDTTFTSVTIPVGGDYSMLSNLTVLFNESGDIVQYGETLISENDAGNFNITSFTDGELVNSNDTDLPYMTDAQLQQDAASGEAMATAGAGSTAACVAAVLGVSGATAYLIVGACTGACTVPGVGTAVCVACIGAYATVGGASITAVASCF